MPRTSTGSSSLPERAGIAVPATREEVRAALEALGIRPSRRLGQSFLCDPFVADAEVALLEAQPRRRITEVGPGLGVLTEALLRRGLGPVRVLEKDRRLLPHLRACFGSQIQIEEGDALRASYPDGEPVIGNLPFSIATPLLTRWFEQRLPTVVALVQKEVGERLTATPGTAAYGRPTIHAAVYGTVERFAPIPSAAFEPIPAVEGLLLRFRGRSGPLPVPSVPVLESVVRKAFSQRRKQLGRLMERLAGSEREANRVTAAAGWPADWRHRRPGEMAPPEWFALARELPG